MKIVSGMQGTRNQEIVWGDKKEKKKEKKKKKKKNEHKTAERGTRW